MIELSAVMGVCAVLAGISVWLVHVSMQKTRDGKRRLESQQTVARLAETFRRDVHAAVSIAPDAKEKNADAKNGPAWSLQLGLGGVVRYRLETGRVIRDEFSAATNDAAAAKTATAHETFNLSPTAETSIRIEPSSQPRIAALLIDAPKTAAADGKQNPRFCIEAALSIDQRFQQIVTPADKKADAPEPEKSEKEKTPPPEDKKPEQEKAAPPEEAKK